MCLRPASCVLRPPADLVLGWKSEREQVHAGVRELAKQKKELAGRCGVELQEVAQAMVLGQARKLQELVLERVTMLQGAASRAVQVFYRDVSRVGPGPAVGVPRFCSGDANL